MLETNPVTGKRNNGKRYTDEDRKWVFETTERLGIGAHSNQMRKLMEERWGKAPSKATVQTWVKPQEKENIKRRSARYREESPRYIMSRRLAGFKIKKLTGKVQNALPIAETARAKRSGLDSAFKLHMGDRLKRFQNKGQEKVVRYKSELAYQIEDAEAHWAVTQDYNKETQTVKCGICKEEFNWMTEAFELDHIDPRKGNGLDNCQITHSMCNQMKTSMTMEELVALCEKVIGGNK